jgi:hypothetical protein
MAPSSTDYAPFAADVSKGTGLDFYMIEGWAHAEGGPIDNPLNLVPGTHYGSEHAAAVATIANLKTAKYAEVLKHTDPNAPLNYALYGPYKGEDAYIAAQAHAVAQSPWKGNDGLPRDKYESNIDAGAAQAIYQGVVSNSHTDPSGGGVNPVNGPTYDGPGSGVLSGLDGIVQAIQRAFAWLSNPETWKRIGLGVGGVVLLVGGLFVIVKGSGAVPVPV